MEVIKKKIKRSTIVLSNGKIVPNLNVNYHINLLLTSKAIDWGFFDIAGDGYYGGSYYYGGSLNYYGGDDPIGILNLV